MVADIIVIAILAVCMFLAIRHIVSDRRKGIGSCGYACSECPSHGSCSANHSAAMKKRKVSRVQKHM